MKRRNGFTLMELLVVIAIIGLLMAILVPSLSRVRKRARATLCSTNERGLVDAYRMYVQEMKTVLSSTGHGDKGAWDFQLLGQGMNQSSTMTPGQYAVSNGSGGASDKFRFCPENQPEKRITGTQLGSATLAWDCRAGPPNGDPKAGTTGSYAMNNWLYNPSSVAGKGTTEANQFYPLMRLAKETTVPVFADSIWHDVIPESNDTPSPNTTDPGSGTECASRTLADVAVNRHNRAVNVSFWDGHVETVKLGDLWTLQWNNGWSRSNAAVVNN